MDYEVQRIRRTHNYLGSLNADNDDLHQMHTALQALDTTNEIRTPSRTYTVYYNDLLGVYWDLDSD